MRAMARAPEDDADRDRSIADQNDLPVFPGFREIAADRRSLLSRLVTRRQELGLSQTEVAARMGTSQSAVARLERGDGDVRLSTLDRYAGALGEQVGFGLTTREPTSEEER
jgi:ribosome-binding protein aMBF1 (putative translation factor)